MAPKSSLSPEAADVRASLMGCLDRLEELPPAERLRVLAFVMPDMEVVKDEAERESEARRGS